MTRLTNQQKIQIAKYIADDNLENINRISEKVHIRQSFYTKYGKRILDIIVSLIALIITSPINLVLAVCTFIDVGRPIFFKQKRPGKDGREFTIVKFRNMTNATDANGNLLPAKDRVTKFGKFVRKTSLDELLNYWSILKGDMSLIGPRPLKQEYLCRYSERHKMRLAVKPGLECPLMHDTDGGRLGWQEQFENDVWYVENVSFIVDCKMLFRLFKLVFDKRSRKHRSEATKYGFMGYDSEGVAINVEQIPKIYIDRLISEESLVAATLENA